MGRYVCRAGVHDTLPWYRDHNDYRGIADGQTGFFVDEGNRTSLDVCVGLFLSSSSLGGEEYNDGVAFFWRPEFRGA